MFKISGTGHGKTNNYTSPGGGHYHDEWFAGDNGGGQELIHDGEELQKPGLTTKDVNSSFNNER